MIIDSAAYVDGRRHDFDVDDMSIDAVCADRGFVWLGLRMPTADRLTEWCAALELADFSPVEILTPHARPVLSIDEHTVHLVLRTAEYDDSRETVNLGEMTIIVGNRSILTVRHGHASALSDVRASLEADPERLRLGPPAVFAAVITKVIEDYGPALDGFEGDAVEVERDVFSDVRRQPVERLYRLKREVRRMLVAIDALQDPLARLIHAYGPRLDDDVLADLHEAADQLDRAVTRAHSLSGLLDAALTASLTQISVRQNDDMRRISAWVAMAAVPTLLAGIYGMNFSSMPGLGLQAGFVLVIVAMIVVVGVLYRMFRRSGWL